MACLVTRRGTWYARVLWYEEDATRQTEKQVPLRTKSKTTARRTWIHISDNMPGFA